MPPVAERSVVAAVAAAAAAPAFAADTVAAAGFGGPTAPDVIRHVVPDRRTAAVAIADADSCAQSVTRKWVPVPVATTGRTVAVAAIGIPVRDGPDVAAMRTQHRRSGIAAPERTGAVVAVAAAVRNGIAAVEQPLVDDAVWVADAA